MKSLKWSRFLMLHRLRKPIVTLLVTLLVALMVTASAWAMSLQEAAERVARQYDAKVVSAQTQERDGRRVHVIRILTKDGVVRTIRVPADRG